MNREITLTLTLSDECSNEYANVSSELVVSDFLRVSMGASLCVADDNISYLKTQAN